MLSGDEVYGDDVTSGRPGDWSVEEGEAQQEREYRQWLADQEARCRFCHRYVIDGLYTRVSFPDGVANVCDNCHEKRDEDTATWRDTEVEVI